MADEAKAAAAAVAVAEESNAAERAELETLLGGEGTTDGKGAAAVETEGPAETEEIVDPAADGAAVAEETDELVDETTEPAAEEETEEDLSLEEGDRDYSDAAYKKAAEFYSKKLKVQFNPDDAKDRVTLSRLLKDKEALAAQRAELDANANVAETDEEKARKAKEVTDAAPKAPTEEQIQSAITNLQTYAKTRVVPKVALHITNRFTTALSKMIDKDSGEWKVTQEGANDFAEVFTEMGMHLLNDQLANLIEKNFQAIGSDPIMSRMTGMAVREGAFEHLDSLKDGTGKQLYPELESMVESGAIQAALKANPWIQKSTFDEKDPIRREAKRIEAAYKIARGEKVVQNTSLAVETGKKQAEAAARARGAARVAPGKTKGPIGQQPTDSETIVKHITTSTRGKFSRMLSEGKDK